MAKELPYFKFEPQAWDTGNIQMCSRESKGLFADLCSLYWSRLGELPYALALQKLCNGNEDALQELQKHDIFGIIDQQIVIEFLDEQLSELNQLSEKRRKAAQKRWGDASAMQVHSKSNAKRREENRMYIDHGVGKISVTIRKTYASDKIHRIFELHKYYEYTGQLENMTEKGWVHFHAFLECNAGKMFNDQDHLYNTFRNFCIEYKPPPAADNPYAVAEERRRDWKLEAFEQEYDKQLKTDNAFRKHFGYGELSGSTSVGSNGQRGQGP